MYEINLYLLFYNHTDKTNFYLYYPNNIYHIKITFIINIFKHKSY